MAVNDPQITNLGGHRFDILALGSFLFLSGTNTSSQSPMLSLHASIDRAGATCGATYIQNISLGGTWIKDIDADLTEVTIQATPDVLRSQSLQVALHDQRQTPQKAQGLSKLIKKATNNVVEFDIRGIQLQISIDAHRIRSGEKFGTFANFLNLHVNGVQVHKEDGVELGGLLAFDDHSFAAQAPEECKAQLKHPKTFKLMDKQDDEEPQGIPQDSEEAIFVSEASIYPKTLNLVDKQDDEEPQGIPKDSEETIFVSEASIYLINHVGEELTVSGITVTLLYFIDGI